MELEPVFLHTQTKAIRELSLSCFYLYKPQARVWTKGAHHKTWETTETGAPLITARSSEGGKWNTGEYEGHEGLWETWIKYGP